MRPAELVLFVRLEKLSKPPPKTPESPSPCHTRQRGALMAVPLAREFVALNIPFDPAKAY
jgi:hypothetical protein